MKLNAIPMWPCIICAILFYNLGYLFGIIGREKKFNRFADYVDEVCREKEVKKQKK